MSEKNGEDIVKWWVGGAAQSAEEMAGKLEKFACDMAESVVGSMEKDSEKKALMKRA